MFKPAKKREKKPPLGSHKATMLASEALRQLLKVRAQQALLKRRAALLKKIIIEQGAGSAHGYRSYVYHIHAYRTTRVVNVKEHDELKLVALT